MIDSNKLIIKIDDLHLDINLLVNEFDEFIKSKLFPEFSPGLIQRKYRLVENNKFSDIIHKITYTKTIVDLILNRFSFKDVTYRSVQCNTAYNWHTDPGQICVHIPLITNHGCRFVYENVNFYMPADGSVFFVKNKDFHTFVNAGSSPRVHLTFENL